VGWAQSLAAPVQSTVAPISSLAVAWLWSVTTKDKSLTGGGMAAAPGASPPVIPERLQHCWMAL
jgi:hypothetical protein